MGKFHLTKIKILPELFYFLPALYLILITHKFAPNFPQWDDYNILLLPILELLAADSLSSHLHALLSMHDVHFHIFPRLLLSIGVLTTGDFQLNWITVIGLISLISLFILLRAVSNRDNISIILPASISLILFNPVYYEALYGSTATFGYLVLPLFAFLSLQSACSQDMPRKETLLRTIFFSLCSLLCVANGALVGVTVGLKHLISGSFRAGIIWILLFGSYLIWIWSLSASQGMPEAQAHVTFINLATYFFCLIGSAFGFFNQQLSIVFGVAFTFIYILLALRQSYSRNPTLFYFLVFLYLSVFSNTLGRAALGIEVAYTTSRYSIYSVLIAVVSVMLLERELSTPSLIKKFNYVILTLSLVFALVAINTYQPWYSVTSQRVKDSISRWRTVKDGLLFYIPSEATTWMQEAEKRNIISYPSDAIRPARLLESSQKSQHTDGYSSIEHALVAQSYIAIDGWLIIPRINMSETTINLKLVNSQNSYTYSTELRERPDVARHHYNCCQMTGTKDGGFHLIIDRSRLVPGSYSLYALVAYKAQLFRVDLKKEITLAPGAPFPM